MADAATVYVVDDDQAVAEAVALLVRSAGFSAKTFGSAAAFLEHYTAGERSCLVLDISMPGIDGLRLQEELASKHGALPIIFLTGHGDVPAAVRAMKGGALEFIEKPFDDEHLLATIANAIAEADKRLTDQADQSVVSQRLARLTPRESEIMQMVVRGVANKVIAIELSISERTVELHRSRIKKKMEARSTADLVRMVGSLVPGAAEGRS